MIENFRPPRVVDQRPKKSARERHLDKPAPGRGTASVLDRAVEVIAARGEAMRWMGTPVRAIDYATPVSLLATAKKHALEASGYTQLMAHERSRKQRRAGRKR